MPHRGTQVTDKRIRLQQDLSNMYCKVCAWSDRFLGFLKAPLLNFNHLENAGISKSGIAEHIGV